MRAPVRPGWVIGYATGATVRVEYSLRRPSLARIWLTSDQPGGVAGFVTFFTGLGVLLLVGGVIVSAPGLSSAVRRKGLAGAASALGTLSYVAATVMALGAEAALARYLYWL